METLALVNLFTNAANFKQTVSKILALGALSEAFSRRIEVFLFSSELKGSSDDAFLQCSWLLPDVTASTEGQFTPR